MFETLGNLGDFIGGLAVVISLLYLASQVRQNTREMRTASRREIVEAFRTYNRLFFEPGVNDAYMAGLRRYPDLSAEQHAMFSNLINDHALFFQGAFALHESGSLEDETYEAYLQFFTCHVATPGGAAWWSEISPLYPPRMVAAVGARLESDGVPDLLALDAFAERAASSVAGE